MQTKEDLEDFYKTPDPWGYKTNPDDRLRLKLLNFIPTLLVEEDFERILDIGAGEGLLLEQFPYAKERHAIEISDNAASRIPKTIKRVKEPVGQYDLIIATGMLYRHYDYQTFLDWIYKHSNGIVLLSHYNKIGSVHDELAMKQIFYAEFDYREGKQILRVYDSLS